MTFQNNEWKEGKAGSTCSWETDEEEEEKSGHADVEPPLWYEPMCNLQSISGVVTVVHALVSIWLQERMRLNVF